MKVGSGGAVTWTGNSGTIENMTFISNNATSNGGAIYWNGTDATVKNCVFINNTAASDAGAIYFAGIASNANVINSTFIDNFVTGSNRYGGAICFYGMNATVDAVTLLTILLLREVQYILAIIVLIMYSKFIIPNS